MNRYTPHDCRHDEVVVGARDSGSALTEGMHVLLPCAACDESPLDTLTAVVAEVEELQVAFRSATPDLPLYHWTPSVNRHRIVARGLLPGRLPATHALADMRDLGYDLPEAWRAPYVCFADSPSWAWALSAGQRSAPDGSWDCWQTSLSELVAPEVLPSSDRPSGIHEVRTDERVPKSALWLVGERVKVSAAHPRSTPVYERTSA